MTRRHDDAIEVNAGLLNGMTSEPGRDKLMDVLECR